MQDGSADNPNENHESTQPAGILSSIPDRDGVETWLRNAVIWAEGVLMRGVRVNRLWPSKHGAVTFELAVDLQVFDELGTHMIQGGPIGRIKCGSPCHEAVLDSGWIMNLSLSNTELGISLLSPDRDPRLSVTQAGKQEHTLPELLRGTRTAEYLSLPDDGGDLRRQLLAYRIGKRCVFRLSNDALPGEPSAFLKSFRRMPTEELLETYQCVGSYLQDHSDGRIRAPALLDRLADARVLIFEGAGALAKRLSTSADDIHLAASGLALLHAVPKTCGRSHNPQDEIDIANRWLPILKDTDRQHYEHLHALVKQLTQLSEGLSSRARCLLHRDFYSAQMLVQGEESWIVDLDTLSMGHPEVDIATFSAHLLLDAVIGGSTDDEAESLVRLFVESYRNSRGQLSPDHLRFYMSSATTRLAAIHATRGLDRQSVSRLWRSAERASSWS